MFTEYTTRRDFLRFSLHAAGAAGFVGSGHCRAQTHAAIANQGLSVDHVLADAMRQAPLSMLFEGSSADECRAWQRSFREKLLELLGDIAPPRSWQVHEQSRQQFEDHVRLELVLSAGNIPDLPLYVLLPADAGRSRQMPAVLCVHGHGPHGHDPVVGRRDRDGVAESIQKYNYDYGLQFVRRGYVVAAPCMIPFGRRVDRKEYGGNDPCAVTFVRMQALGRLPLAENLRDLRWCLNLLERRPEVRGDRIGCAGLSYGGRMTMMVSAVDTRVRVAAVSGALNLQQERLSSRHSCGSQIIPGLLKYGDYSEIGSLIAPRPCVWEVGSEDPLIIPKWDALFRDRLRRVYGALDARKHLHFDDFQGGHRWSGSVAYSLFDAVLKDDSPDSSSASARNGNS